MCFTIPKKIISLNKDSATIEGGDKIDVSMIDSCQVGDFVVVNGPIAIGKVENEKALATRQIIKENL